MDKEFAESYKTSEWQRKKNRILERDKYTCQICGNTTGVMQVHHITYEHCNGKAYNALDKELITLCKECHSHDDGDHVHFFSGSYELRVPHGDFPFPTVEDKTEKARLLREIYERDVRIGQLEKKLDALGEELTRTDFDLFMLDSMEYAKWLAKYGCEVNIEIFPDERNGLDFDENGNVTSAEDVRLKVSMVPHDWCHVAFPEWECNNAGRVSVAFELYRKVQGEKERELCNNTK